MAKVLESTKNFFCSTETPRWQLIVGGALVLLAPIGHAEWVSWRENHLEVQAAADRRIEERLKEIEQKSADWHTFSGAFVAAVLDSSESVEDQRQLLLDNMLAQDAVIDLSSRIFDQETQITANKYRDTLQNLMEATRAAHDVKSLSPFWEAASDALVARNVLLNDLSRQVNSSS